ncbi:Type II DNA topoisomerase VI subunit B [Gracilaria domingensis]|nr:Type II DNA topoisomerase VI subunit B [Gracilaria domingensis]
MLDFARRGRHVIGAAGEDGLKVLGTGGVKLGEKLEAKLRVGRDDGHLAHVGEDLGAIGAPVALDGDGHGGAAPFARVVGLGVLDDSGHIVGDVNVEHAFGDGAVLLRCGDVHRQAGAHLGPDERHLGAEPKFTARLPHAVLGARQDAPHHVGHVAVRHAAAVVLHGDAEDVAAQLPRRLLRRGGLLLLLRGVLRGAVRRTVCGALRKALLLGLAEPALLDALHVLVQRVVDARARGVHAQHGAEGVRRDALHGERHVGQLVDGLCGVEGVFYELADGGVQRLAGVVEAGDVLVLGEELGRRLELELGVGLGRGACALAWRGGRSRGRLLALPGRHGEGGGGGGGGKRCNVGREEQTSKQATGAREQRGGGAAEAAAAAAAARDARRETRAKTGGKKREGSAQEE